MVRRPPHSFRSRNRGMDVVDEIANLPTGMQDKPVNDVVIEKINIK